MGWRPVVPRPSLFVAALGAGLFLVAAAHHAAEVAAVGGLGGPLLALALDGLPALGLVYAGYWLSGTDLPVDRRRTVLLWCLAGAALFTAVVWSGIAVRLYEGRSVSEPTLELLLAADGGAIAGFVAGYYGARAREDAARAEQATDAVAFINGVLRHDLRNDLAVIEGHAGMIADGAADPDAARDHAATIGRKADEAASFIETAGEMAETLAGDREFERVDLAEVVRDSIDRLTGRADVRVDADLPESAPVDADSGLRSVVDNLLENAVEHNDADDPWIEAVVEVDDAVRLWVRDNGPGIDGEAVFEAREVGTHGGGLHLVATLVERYGGEIGVVEENRPGATVRVELPRSAR